MRLFYDPVTGGGVRRPALALGVIAFLLLPLLGPASSCRIGAQVRGEGGEIHGRVLGMRGSAASGLSHALIQGTNRDRYFAVVADSLGRFRAEDLAPGTWSLHVLHVGYESLQVDVRVPRSGKVDLEVELPWVPIELPPLLVQAVPLSSLWSQEMPSDLEKGEVALRTLEAGTGMVETGITALARSVPGEDPADPRDVLLLRGAAADLKLVLLDGVPVYTPFHVGGMVEGLDPSALGGASLFLGGAPARFDGGLSYIMDLRTRSPRRDRFRGKAAVDFLSESVALEGPVTGSGGFLFSSRALHDLGSSLLNRGSSPYGYMDALARVDWVGPGATRFFLTGFWNQEDVNLNLSRSSDPVTAPEENTEEKTLLRNLLPDENARWGNGALSGGLEGRIGEGRGELRLAGSRYEARLPLGDSLPYYAHGRSGRFRATGDVVWPLDSGVLRLGGSFDRHTNWYYLQRLDAAQYNSRTELESTGESGGIYGEISRPVLSEVQFRGGLRADWFSGDPGVRLAPRLALTWLLTDAAALTVAVGRYHQYLPLPIENVSESMDGSPFAGDESGELEVGSADHLVVTLDQELTPGLRMGLEGFVKEFRSVPGAEGNVLNASGVDLRVAREGDRISGWLGYTLTWFWSDENVDTGGDSFTGRNLLSAGLTTRIWDRTGLDLRVGYGGGLPYTSVPILDAQASLDASESATLNAERVLNDAPGFSAPPDQSFLRVDAEVYGLFSPSLGEHALEIRPYLKVLNALDRRDALFYHFDQWRNEEPRPLAELPLLPLAGVEVRF